MAFWFFKRRENKKRRGERPKVALCLSGGGAKGFAHVGALKAFAEHNVDFDMVTGASAGALVGAMYAFGVSVERMLELGASLNLRDIRDRTFAPSNAANIEALARGELGDALFSDLKKPFAAVAVDLKTGGEVVLNMGNVARAVSASCCVPGIFRPVVWNDYHLVDGGLKNVIPSDAARAMGADRVVSVDANGSRGMGTDSLKLLDVLRASLRIAVNASAKWGISQSDITLFPDTEKYRSGRKDGFGEMIAAGYKSASESMDAVKALFRNV